jgi:CDP-glucose 4,6-dehydratase
VAKNIVSFQSQALSDTYCGKKILVTGHTGFKGSWLVFILKHLGANVAGLSIEPPSNLSHAYYALGVSELLSNRDSQFGDVRNLETIEDIFQSQKPDFVFHLAAQALVSASYVNPVNTFTTNVLGTLHILETLRGYPETASVIVTSDKCYQNDERSTAYFEDDRMGGDDPYSASKGAAELLFHSYTSSFADLGKMNGVSSVRAGNVFGGGDWSDNRLVPDCIRDLYSTNVIHLRMPEATRPWTFVIDILLGYLQTALVVRSRPDMSKSSWNFASGEVKTVLDVAQGFVSAFGFGTVTIDEDQSIGKEANLLQIDATKARENLAWQPLFTVDEAIQLTASWYAAQHAGEDMAAFSNSFLASTFHRF